MAAIEESLPPSEITSAYMRDYPVPVDQDSPLPSTRDLIRPVDATRPAAQPRPPCHQFFTGPCNAALTGWSLLDVIDQADSCQAASGLPSTLARRSRLGCNLKVVRRLVHCTMEKDIGHEFFAEKHVLAVSRAIDDLSAIGDRGFATHPHVGDFQAILCWLMARQLVPRQ